MDVIKVELKIIRKAPHIDPLKRRSTFNKAERHINNEVKEDRGKRTPLLDSPHHVYLGMFTEGESHPYLNLAEHTLNRVGDPLGGPNTEKELSKEGVRNTIISLLKVNE